jgi:hypothetical protein
MKTPVGSSMATSSPTFTTPEKRISRLLGEGVRILAVHGSGSGIDITHDITGLLEELRKREPVASSSASDAATASDR